MVEMEKKNDALINHMKQSKTSNTLGTMGGQQTTMATAKKNVSTPDKPRNKPGQDQQTPSANDDGSDLL